LIHLYRERIDRYGITGKRIVVRCSQGGDVAHGLVALLAVEARVLRQPEDMPAGAASSSGRNISCFSYSTAERASAVRATASPNHRHASVAAAHGKQSARSRTTSCSVPWAGPDLGTTAGTRENRPNRVR
jgi:hypothetical protein